MQKISFLFLGLFFSSNLQARTLDFQSYLNLVKENNLAIRASQLASTGAQIRQDDGELILSPILSIEGSYLKDKRETSSPTFQGTSTNARTASASIAKLTSFGLSAKLAYSMQFTDIAQASLLNPARYYTAAPSIELRQSIWRNGFGSETQAQQAVLKNANQVSAESEKFKNQQQWVEAQNTYWRLTSARQLVSVQKEVLNHAEKIYQWASERAKLQLGEKTDMLQAEASLQLRKIELANALEEERLATTAFNLALQRDPESSVEDLDTINPETLLQLKAPLRKQNRADTNAALAGVRLAAANGQLAKEKATPSLDLFASHSLNGKDPLWSPASSESLTSKYPVTTLGVKFAMPLDIGLLIDTRRGASQEIAGAELLLDRKNAEAEKDWQDLQRKFTDAKQRLELARSLERLQKEKMLNEQDRLKRGRSTTYQTLVFEQDYAQAQALRIRVQTEILAYHNQLKLYGSEL